MPLYRYSFFEEGLLVGTTELELTDDQEALRATGALSVGGDIEVCEVRVVGRVTPEDAAKY